ncbi:hypothetical protein [Amycolatopsis saalfeldensis]|uniref:DUF8017 domain-containing protein n=1 Tax=Amycolatopsis saalfeldensis TaxID=394193 RepID=A0A1H8YMP0_9PSEU|nr:hypothetical protein [Amycolatopsis saalfeldensis]SEP53455.1 hypothetical protein SAMN04489732_12751 [Amycolatopsis saalfeldensis]
MFGRNRKRRDGGYQDNAALTGFGGYEPSDTPTTGYGEVRPPETTRPSAQASGIAEPFGPGAPVSGVAESLRGKSFGPGVGPAGSGNPAQGPWPSAAVPGEPGVRAEPQRIRPPGKPGRRRRGSRVAWAVVVVLGLGAAALNVFSTGDHRSTPSRPPVGYTPEPRVTVPAVVAGWQSVAGRDGSYAYDVPPSWTPKPGTVHGWDKTTTAPGITLGTSAFVDEGFCPGVSDSRRGGAGVTTEPTGDAEQAVRKAVDDLAVSAYGPESARTPGPGEDATVQIGRTPRPTRMVFADVVPKDGGPCASKHVVMGAIAISGPSSSAVLVAYADQDVPRDDLTRILRSYRGVLASDRVTSTPAAR